MVNSTYPRFVNSQLVCYQPVGICTQFLLVYLRIAVEAVGTPRLEFSLSYRVTFLSRMYYTTGVSKRTFGIFFFYLTQLLINRSAANLSNISVFLTYFNFLYTLETNLWFIHVVSFPCFPGGTFAWSFSSYLAVWRCWIFVVVLPSVHGSGWQRIIPILSCPLCAVLMLLCVCTWKTGRVKWVNKADNRVWHNKFASLRQFGSTFTKLVTPLPRIQGSLFGRGVWVSLLKLIKYPSVGCFHLSKVLVKSQIYHPLCLVGILEQNVFLIWTSMLFYYGEFTKSSVDGS